MFGSVLGCVRRGLTAVRAVLESWPPYWGKGKVMACGTVGYSNCVNSKECLNGQQKECAVC